MRMLRLLAGSACLVVTLVAAHGCFSNLEEECLANGCVSGPGGAGGSGGTAGMGGNGAEGGIGAQGGGGANGGGGSGGMPECMNDANCTDAAAAHCDNGSCVPCVESPHCEGVTGLPICDDGTCVECLLGEEDACAAPQTCDLLAKACVDVAPLSALNCRGCTNDLQCATGHRCIEMDFESQPHGHYCLKEADPSCNSRPFTVPINKPSLSGAAATNYCGIEEDLTTCEAVTALLQGWVCEAGMTDGMCGPVGMPEIAVPGALCETVGLSDYQCTYACAGASECLSAGSAATCGTGTGMGNGWCGG